MKKRKRPWPRWAKIVRNLTAAALLVPLIWAWIGAPVTVKGQLRRYERQCLLPRGEIVLASSDHEGLEPRIYVSVSDAAVVTVGRDLRSIDLLEGDGPELFPWRGEAMWASEGRTVSTYAYILVHPPEKAAGARLTVTNRVASYTARGEDTGGAFLFIMPPPSGDDTSFEDWQYPENYSWEITYLDAQGREIAP